MKVLQINNVHYRRGGADAVYLNTAELLQRHGDEVTFFNMKRKDNLPCKDEKYWVESLESRPSGIKSKFVDLRNFFYNPEAARKIEELIVAKKPDIAHVHLFYGMGISPSICKVLRKHHIPLVHTAHDYRMICPVALLMDSNGRVCEACKGKHFYKSMLKGCSHNGRAITCIKAAEMYYHNCIYHPTKVMQGIIFVSHFSKRKHFEYLPSLETIHSTVIYNFCQGVALRDSVGGEFFLYYGRLAQEKGLPTLIEAFRQNPLLSLKIIGAGPMEEELRKSLPKNVEMLGPKYGDELFSWVKKARFVCVPSECYENNPMTIVEAYSHGVPVIGSDLGGITEVVENGKTGFLFEPKNVKQLSALLQKAVDMKAEDYEMMSRNASMFAKNNFSPEQHYKKLTDFYKEVLNKYHSKQS